MTNLNLWLNKGLLILLYEIGLSHLFRPLDFTIWLLLNFVIMIHCPDKQSAKIVNFHGLNTVCEIAKFVRNNRSFIYYSRSVTLRVCFKFALKRGRFDWTSKGFDFENAGKIARQSHLSNLSAIGGITSVETNIRTTCFVRAWYGGRKFRSRVRHRGRGSYIYTAMVHQLYLPSVPSNPYQLRPRLGRRARPGNLSPPPPRRRWWYRSPSPPASLLPDGL